MKIKYLDTNEIIEVTNAQQLYDTKARVTAKHTEEAQQELFNMGLQWSARETGVIDEACHLYIHGTGSLTYTTRDADHFFNRHVYREFEFISSETNILNQIRAVEGASRFVETYDKVNGGWVSVEDRLPKFSEECLFTNVNVNAKHGRGIVSVGYHYKKAVFKSLISTDGLTATHWMPLPEPPKTLNS